ncbi:acyl-CoA carboxylase subunit epsilon, partial [Saccharothrix algeriensis]
MTAEPFLEVVRGAPDDVELAALTAVVAALAAAGAPAGQRPRRSAWADRARPC